jgi:formylglycine-generating enzyme required for sulfatase activity
VFFGFILVIEICLFSEFPFDGTMAMNTRVRFYGLFIATINAFVLLQHVIGDEAKLPEQNRDAKAAASRADPYRRFAGKEIGQQFDDNSLKMELIWCPPGKFVMGPVQVVDGKQVNESEEVDNDVRQLIAKINGRRKDTAKSPDVSNDDVIVDLPTPDPDVGEKRRELQVLLMRGYWLGKYEVTRRQWTKVMATQPWDGRRLVLNGDDFPATFISWNDATEFCRRFTRQEQDGGRLPIDWEYSLPTDAQWERACRARTKTRFSFGDSLQKLDDFAWFAENTVLEPYPHRVGQKKPNPWGLFDMHGNVLEWCKDWYAIELPGGRDPEVKEVKEVGLNKVNRGGFWGMTGSACSSAARFMAPPEVRRLDFGFRVALVYLER